MIYTSGIYSPGAPLAFGNDFHASFLSDWLRFAGITDVTEIRFQPTILTATPDEPAVARAPEGLQLKCFTAAISILAALM